MDGYDPNKQFTWYLIFVYENKNPDPNTMDLIDALFSQSLYTLLNTSIQQNRYAALSSFFFFFFKSLDWKWIHLCNWWAYLANLSCTSLSRMAGSRGLGSRQRSAAATITSSSRNSRAASSSESVVSLRVVLRYCMSN